MNHFLQHVHKHTKNRKIIIKDLKQQRPQYLELSMGVLPAKERCLPEFARVVGNQPMSVVQSVLQ